MRPDLSSLAEWAGRTSRRHKLALFVIGLWVGVTARVFGSGDPTWITAQSANYGTLTVGALGFATASLGIRTWEDVQMSPPTMPTPDAGAPG